MNKKDIIFIVIVISVSIILYFSFNKISNSAYVYYDNRLLNTIDLSIDKEYEIEGYNGKIILEVKNKKIGVKEENSNYHICSKQGFTNKGSIVCLPNKVVITFSNDNLDTVVG